VKGKKIEALHRAATWKNPHQPQGIASCKPVHGSTIVLKRELL
jgi:hypothetical protein